MNPIVEEMRAILDRNEDELIHYGMPRRSGRYPWGSGKDPYQRSIDFLSRVEELKKTGWKETPDNVKEEFGLTSKEYRMEKSIANYERRLHDVATAKSLQKDGLGPTEIGRKMGGINESTVRSLLNEGAESRMHETMNTVKFLKDQVDNKKMIDVGAEVNRELNVSRDRLDTALYYLENIEGYPVYGGRMPQPTNPGQFTTQRVLCVPGTEHKEIYNYDKIQTINDYVTRDGGETFMKKFTYPESMDSSRLKIRYAEEGGLEKDGAVELRRGVPDLSLGESRYAQVRILVDGSHYIKGMAVYSDDMPPGVDVIFNTNKTKGTPMEKVLKEIKKDPDNPFGSAIKDADQGGQYWYDDPKTGKKKLGLINKRADEGDWSDWKDSLPSQFLGKQSVNMAKKQLDLAKADKLSEYDEICSLTNPTIKKHLLEKFASNADSAAVHLQAAALPGQKYHVIMPFPTMKETEVYAPRYENGTKLALIRYPHGGTFEIPVLTVNNKHALAKKLLGTDAGDAIGINSKVAERLSGADFDGDTAMTIPTHDSKGRVKISTRPPLQGLEGFDPKLEYPEVKGMKYMTKTGTQREMGIISNLITDMTLKGAGEDKLAQAVRHSMVVIDAEKHKLNYKKSEIDNNIAALKKEYQRSIDDDGKVRYGGASTLLSRSKGEATVLKRQGMPNINMKGKKWYDPSKPEGALIYKVADDVEYTLPKLSRTAAKAAKELGNTVVPKIDKKTGEVILVTTTPEGKKTVRKASSDEYTLTVKQRTQKSTRMAEVDDAYKLISDANTPMERVYADYANSMKSLANQARKEMMTTGKIQYSASAKDVYQHEVFSLMNKLNTALLNTTRERAAQRKANAEVNAKLEINKDMSKEDLKKERQRALSSSRVDVGSVSRRDRSIKITDKEWEAIQAGAISETKLKQILNNADVDELRQRATPRSTTSLSPAKVNRIKAMKNSNYSLEQIAKALGIPTSTVYKYMK